MKYWILSYEPNGLKDFFSIEEINAKDIDEAKNILNEGQTNYSTDLLLNKSELDDLIKTISDFKFNQDIKEDLIRDEVRDVEDLYESDDDIDEEMEVKADLVRKYDNPKQD